LVKPLLSGRFLFLVKFIFMRSIFTFLSFLLISLHAKSQDKSVSPSRNISISGGRSFHGSGDQRGVQLSAEYGKYFKKKLEWSAGFASAIHSDETLLLLNYPNAETIDASYRTTTAGIQFYSLISFAPVHSLHHEVKISGGGLVRYQSDSYSGYGIYFPPTNNFPEPFFTFRNNDKQNTINAGYLVELGYAYTFKNNMLISTKAGFQNDTNGDVLTNYCIRVGKRF